MTETLFTCFRRRRIKLFSLQTYTEHALIGAAYTAHTLGRNPCNSKAEREAYEWAEGEFNRIARREVGERDLIG